MKPKLLVKLQIDLSRFKSILLNYFANLVTHIWTPNNQTQFPLTFSIYLFFVSHPSLNRWQLMTKIIWNVAIAPNKMFKFVKQMSKDKYIIMKSGIIYRFTKYFNDLTNILWYILRIILQRKCYTFTWWTFCFMNLIHHGFSSLDTP